MSAKKIFIIEDSEDDFNFIKKIVLKNDYLPNNFDENFRYHFERFCDDENNTSEERAKAIEYIRQELNKFDNIDLFILDFELEEDGIEYCNSLMFIDEFILKNNELKSVPFLIISSDVKDFHTELDKRNLKWIRKDTEWKANNKQGQDWRRYFSNKIFESLGIHTLGNLVNGICGVKKGELSEIKSIIKEYPSIGSTELLVKNQGFEKIIGDENNITDVSKLKKLLQCIISVCRVTNSKKEYGTGFILEGGYLLTNNHVIEDADLASKTKVQFNYEKDKDGKIIEPIEFFLDNTTFITNKELDYTYIKIIDKDDKLNGLGFLKIEDFTEVKVDDKVTLIHHPQGDIKKFSTDKVISVWNNNLFYIADTEEGSSGAPILNSDLNVIGIHNRGDNIKGLVINKEGDMQSCNAGILIQQILDDIKTQQN